MLLAVILFSAMDTLAKLALRSYPLPGLLWARYTVHVLFMVAIAAPHMGMKLLRSERAGLQVVRGCCSFSAPPCSTLVCSSCH